MILFELLIWYHSKMEFRRLNQTDLQSYFANRLRALADAPSAFLTTLDEEKERGLAHFSNVLSSTTNDNVIFGAITTNGPTDSETVVGTIGVYRENRPKLVHRAVIWGMYVDRPHRNLGYAGRLVDLAVAHAKTLEHVSVLSLSVESTNRSAIGLYKSKGFKCWGTEPKAMYFGGTYFDEDHMALDLGL